MSLGTLCPHLYNELEQSHQRWPSAACEVVATKVESDKEKELTKLFMKTAYHHTHEAKEANTKTFESSKP